MKKLNKKGFTLVELLAVIVILAVIMVLTIPTVLNSMGGARQSAFETAVSTVEDYMKKQIDACSLGDINMAKYDAEIFADTATCRLKGASSSSANNENGVLIIKKAGYEGEIASIHYNVETGEIGYATAPSTGEFANMDASNTVGYGENSGVNGYYNSVYND